jgi:hypothetical protein
MTAIRSSQVKTEATINSIRVEQAETMKLRVEDVLVSVERLTQDLR